MSLSFFLLFEDFLFYACLSPFENGVETPTNAPLYVVGALPLYPFGEAYVLLDWVF